MRSNRRHRRPDHHWVYRPLAYICMTALVVLALVVLVLAPEAVANAIFGQ